MKSFILAALLLSLTTCGALAPAQVATDIQYIRNADGSVTIVVAPEHVKQCDEQGGCGLVSRAWVLNVIAQTCGVQVMRD